MKLDIQFIPYTTIKCNVRSAVSPTVWQAIKQKEVARANGKCETCGGEEDLECHEMWQWVYGQPNIQRLVRLIILCGRCHACVHIGVYNRKGYFTEGLIEHTMEVNKWTRQEFEDAYHNAVCLAIARGEAQWVIDFSSIHDVIAEAEKFFDEVEVEDE